MTGLKALIAVVLSCSLLFVCADLSGGIAILSSGLTIRGTVVENNNDHIILGYGNGRLKINNLFVKETVNIENMSDYGKLAPVPPEESLSVLERYLPDSPNEALEFNDMLMSRHSIGRGELVFSLDLPRDWNTKIISERGIETRLWDNEEIVILAEVLETPSIPLDKQAEVAEASIKTELGSFNLIYSRAATTEAEDSGICNILGYYRSANGSMTLKTTLIRNTGLTFIISMFVPSELYNSYEPLYSLCRESISIRRAVK